MNAALEFPKFEMPKFDMPAFDLPKIDAETVMATQRRSVDAMTSAGQILADGVQTFGQRQAEIMQARMNELGAQFEDVVKAKDQADLDVSGQIDDMRDAYTQAVADVRELVDIVFQAQVDALEVMNHCFIANFEDMKKFAD
ncbi:MAG: phasin family protein [Pseudomonadota bacterium]